MGHGKQRSADVSMRSVYTEAWGSGVEFFSYPKDLRSLSENREEDKEGDRTMKRGRYKDRQR